MMRNPRRFAAAALFVASGTCAHVAGAASMDPALARLVTSDACRTGGPTGTGQYYNPASGFARCTPDHAAFARLINQYGFAFAPPVMHSARTTGYGGFEVTLEGTFTTIDSSADYWVKGTEGPDDEVENLASVENASPASMLPVYALKFRKGFPFGFELAASFGNMAMTSFWVAGADARLSLLEGFRRGIPGVLPDIAAGGSVRTVTGSDQFQLTVLGLDGVVSKPIPMGGTVVLTPYLGYQYLRIFGDSGLIDLTPNTDAVNYCGFSGVNTPATPDPSKQDRDGQPICGSGTPADFNNSVVFDAVRLNRHRGIAGAQVRANMFRFGAQVMFDLMSPASANPSQTREVEDANSVVTQVNDLDGVPSQFAFALDAGVIF